MTPEQRAVLDAATACAQGEPGDIQLWDAMASAVDALEQECICGTPGLGDFEGPLRDCTVHGEPEEQPEVSHPTATVILRPTVRGVVDLAYSVVHQVHAAANSGQRYAVPGLNLSVEVRL